MLSGPESVAGHAVWRAGAPGLAVLFAGRGPAPADRAQLYRQLTGVARPIAWAAQIHSARVLAASPGPCGEGDALIQPRFSPAGAVLSIVTADCVPVLLATATHLAAVHAGWRGIAQSIVARTLEALAAAASTVSAAPGGSAAAVGSVAPAASPVQAWIGPAIGPCCYETGDDVAAQVIAASTAAVATQGPNGRPHLDLQAAVRRQLQAGGVTSIETLAFCTRCHPELLYSYRRDGKGAGRNHAFIAAG